MALTGILAGVSGVSTAANFLDQLFESNAADKRIKDYRKELKKLFISDEEASRLKNKATSAANTQTLNILNSNAVGSERFGNTGVAKAVGIAPVLAETTRSLFDFDQEILEQNQRTQMKLAESQLLDPGRISIGETIASGISGLQAGISLDDYLNSEENYRKKIQTIKELNEPSISSILDF